MAGAIVLSGKRYPLVQYITVALIVGGVVLVSAGKATKPPQSCAAAKDCKGKGMACNNGLCEEVS